MFMATVAELREFLTELDGDLPVIDGANVGLLRSAEATEYSDDDGFHDCVELTFGD